MKIAILAAGDYPRKAYPKYLLSTADILICCDSALDTALRHGLEPAAVVGDLDSAGVKMLKSFTGKIVHVSEQDDNDLTKAMHYTVDTYQHIESIAIFGATGKHEAHTIGNLSLLMEYERIWKFWEKNIDVQIVSDYCTAFAVGQSCALQVGEGRKVSLFCTDPTLRIHSTGLQWPLDGVEFGPWWRATLNRATDDEITLEMNHDAQVLVILE